MSDSATAPLAGRRVAVLEARLTDTLVSLMERAGAEVVRAPALREHPLEATSEVAAFCDTLDAGGFAAVVFLTGVGANALLTEAERLGRLDATLDALRGATTVCRGPKPVARLARQGVPTKIAVPEPHTTTELLQALRRLDLAGRRVGLVHYGERNNALTDALRADDVQLMELCLYEWVLPEDVAPLERLVQAILDGTIDVVAFTSQVQVRHLLEIAQRLGALEPLQRQLTTQTVVVAVGPTTASALTARGIAPAVVPAKPKMGPMVAALIDHVAGRR
ncbi:MAG: uroporphyrinogen-III synthase [Vicinamibacteraceae bacterium]